MGVRFDVVVRPEVEGELHRPLVAVAEERLDLFVEADRLVRPGLFDLGFPRLVGRRPGRSLFGPSEAAHRAPLAEVGGERIGDLAERIPDRAERCRQRLAGLALQPPAEGDRVAEALLQQRPGRFPMRDQVVALVESSKLGPAVIRGCSGPTGRVVIALPSGFNTRSISVTAAPAKVASWASVSSVCAK